jgi:hypothetical protein
MNNSLDIFKSFRSLGSDPRQVEQLIYQRYPQMQVLSNQMRQSGLSPVDFVMQMAKQNNIPLNQNDVMGMYQQMSNMIK